MGEVWRQRGKLHLARNVERVDGSSGIGAAMVVAEHSEASQPLGQIPGLCHPSSPVCLSASPFLTLHHSVTVTPPLQSPSFQSGSGPFFPFYFLFLLHVYLRHLWQQTPCPPLNCLLHPIAALLPSFRNAFAAWSVLIIIQALAQKPFPHGCPRL